MRIAIYVRKSKWTGRGESIENQILMCREYIEKFIEDSRDAQILVYSDEGFSGKDTMSHHFDLCEECYDRFTAEFKVPVEEEEATEVS